MSLELKMDQTVMVVNVESDKQTLLNRLRESEMTFIGAAEIPDELAVVCPAANCWSVLQVIEHVGMTERGLLGRFHASEAASGPPNLDFDQAITKIGHDRSKRRSAPERVVPSGKFSNVNDALEHFRLARQETIRFVENYSDDLRKRKVIHAVAEMDGHQLFLLMAAHAERHALQIEEVKASAAYRAASERKAS